MGSPSGSNGSRNKGSSGARNGKTQGQGQGQAAKPDYKFYALGGEKKQGQNMTYSQVKDYILQYVLKTYDFGEDIEKSLRLEAQVDLEAEKPKRQASKKANEDAKKFEQEGFDIQYKVELDEYMERKKVLKANLIKAYGLIF